MAVKFDYQFFTLGMLLMLSLHHSLFHPNHLSKTVLFSPHQTSSDSSTNLDDSIPTPDKNTIL